MRTHKQTAEQNTENGRTVYRRELPPGRALAGAEPGFYGRDGSFVPWVKLSADVSPFSFPEADRRIAGNELVSIRPAGTGGVYVLPDEIIAVGPAVFKKSEADAVVLPPRLVKIGADAFKDSSIRSVIFPPSFRIAGKYAFCGSKIASAVLPEHQSLVGAYCFSGTEISAVYLPPECGTGDRAFTGSKVRVFAGACPEGDFVFGLCRNLAAASVTSGSELSVGTFCGCGSLESVSLAESISGLGVSVFAECRALRTVRIPQRTADIGARAFYGCSSLSSVRYSGKDCPAGNCAFGESPAERGGLLPAGIRTDSV